jgi:outer membrane protein assembly factor BamB
MRTCSRLFAVFLLAPALSQGADWFQWRGPLGTGVSPDQGFPTRWSKGDVSWRAPLGGAGVSSPVVWGDRVFVTSQAGRGTLRPGNHPSLSRGEEKSETALKAAESEGVAKVEFLVEAFHRDDGRRLWAYRMVAEGDLPAVHEKSNLANPSPVTDGRYVYAWFGTGQLVALDVDGKLAWQRHLGQELGPFTLDWGAGSSPALYNDLLILQCDHGERAHLLALDKSTGRERWKRERGKDVRSYSTPTVVAGPKGDELIVNSSVRLEGWDPSTGELLWYTGDANRFPIPVPSLADGVLYASRGYRSGPYMAIRLGGRGDVSASHVAWSVATGAPYISSLLHYEGLLYMANDVGIVTCVDARTGEKVWQERIEGVYTASPVAAEGRVYLVSEGGDVIVLQAGRQPRILERNALGERTLASPALSEGQIFLRTDEHLVAVGKRGERPSERRAARQLPD